MTDPTEKPMKPLAKTVFEFDGIQHYGPLSLAQLSESLRRVVAYLDEQQQTTMVSPSEKTLPTPMRLPCPECGQLHIDAGEFSTKSHHTHSCQHCGLTWRPAVVPTVGVRFLPGFLDEQHAAGQGEDPITGYCSRHNELEPCDRCAAPPEPAPGSREGAQWSRQFLSTVGDSNLCAQCGKAYLEHRYVTSGGVNISYCPVATPIAEPPAPEDGEPDNGCSKHGNINCSWCLDHARLRSAIARADAAEHALKQTDISRDTALSQVEQLKVELRKRDQLEASLRDDLTETQASYEVRWSEFQGQCAVTVDLREALTAATSRAEQLTAENQQLRGKIEGMTEGMGLRDAEHIRSLSESVARAEAAEARVAELESQLRTAVDDCEFACNGRDKAEARAEALEKGYALVSALKSNAELEARAAKLEAELLTRIAREACWENGPGGDAGERAIVVGSVWERRGSGTRCIVTVAGQTGDVHCEDQDNREHRSHWGRAEFLRAHTWVSDPGSEKP